MSYSYKRTYWIAQLLGWLLYAFLSLFASYVNGSLSLHATMVVAGATLTALGLTHVIRYFFISYSLQERGIPFSVQRAVFLIPVAALVQCGAQFVWQIIFISEYDTTDVTFVSVFYAWINWLVIFTVWTVLYLLYRFIDSNRQAQIRELKLRALQNEIELTQLKSQLNPHFLFNALNSIRALVTENPAMAREAITRLSEMLRQTFLSGRKNTITLDEEMSLVRDYLALEKLRFEERLHNEYAVDASCLQAEVPPFLIQTLAENAIKHGISRLTGGGRVFISIHKQNSWIEIEVRNTGHLTARTEKSTGIGWENSRKRIELLYGSKTSFTVHEENDEVVCVFKIPFRNHTAK